MITATPSGGQRTGFFVGFNASNSVVDPFADITCYEWMISSTNPDPGFIALVRGADAVAFSEPYGDLNDLSTEQDLLVELRISDETNFVCSESVTPPPGIFGENVAQIAYQIRCDLTPPIVEAGANQARSLSDEDPAVVDLNAIASDPESPTNLTYSWDCGNGPGSNSASVTCSYDVAATYTAVVIVQNVCGLITQDSLVVTITP